MEKILFLTTVDTEEEWDWSGRFPLPPFSIQNTKRIPKFQDLCRSLGVVPTYFVDYAIAEDDDASAMLRSYFDAKECDVGAHLHAWCNPPMVEDITQYNSYVHNLPEDLFKEKLNLLVDLLQDRFGTHPFAFRSGRWGINGSILHLLNEAGFTVDTSMRAFYHDSPHIFYDNIPNAPFWPDFSDFQQIGTQRQLLEIPATTGFNRPYFPLMHRLHNCLARQPFSSFRLIGILWHLGIMRKISITPEGHTSADLIACIDTCVKQGLRTINLFFHSSNLLPGNTVYVQSREDEERFYRTIEEVVAHVKTHYDAEFCSIRDAYEIIVREEQFL